MSSSESYYDSDDSDCVRKNYDSDDSYTDEKPNDIAHYSGSYGNAYYSGKDGHIEARTNSRYDINSTYNGDGVKLKGGVYLDSSVSGSYSKGTFDSQGSADAFARAKGKAYASLKDGLGASGNAKTGARVRGEASLGVLGEGDNQTSVSVKGNAIAGAGAKGNLELGKKTRIGGEVKAGAGAQGTAQFGTKKDYGCISGSVGMAHAGLGTTCDVDDEK